jgi:heme-degrading monooxygenase HmoA
MFTVINQLHLNVPVEQIRDATEQEGLTILKSLPGFRGLNLVKLADDRLTVILYWDSAADAENGAKTFGPTWFARHIAPHLASEQQRSAGDVILHYQLETPG